MRSIIPFNDDWLYAPQELPPSTRDDQFEAVTLPHTNIVLPYHNFDNLDYQFISTYRKRFTPAGSRSTGAAFSSISTAR